MSLILTSKPKEQVRERPRRRRRRGIIGGEVVPVGPEMSSALLESAKGAKGTVGLKEGQALQVLEPLCPFDFLALFFVLSLAFLLRYGACPLFLPFPSQLSRRCPDISWVMPRWSAPVDLVRINYPDLMDPSDLNRGDSGVVRAEDVVPFCEG